MKRIQKIQIFTASLLFICTTILAQPPLIGTWNLTGGTFNGTEISDLSGYRLFGTDDIEDWDGNSICHMEQGSDYGTVYGAFRVSGNTIIYGYSMTIINWTNNTSNFSKFGVVGLGIQNVSYSISGNILTVTGINTYGTTILTYVKEGDDTPIANFSVNETNVYTIDIINFTDESTGNVTTWLWDFGDGNTSTDQNPSHTYATAGDYTVSLTVTDGDTQSDTETKTDYIHVTVLTAPVADFSCIPTTGEYPLTIQFTDNSAGDVSEWSWDFGDGYTSSEQDPEHTYDTEGVYTVSLTVTNAAGSDIETKTDYIIVLEQTPPVASFSASPVEGDYPLTVNFTNTTTGKMPDYLWDFGDGTNSTLKNPNHIYSIAGVYTVTLTATNSAGSDTFTETDLITITIPETVADFTSDKTTGNIPLNVQFTDISSGDNFQWLWNFGDGATSIVQNPAHVYTDAGTYTVTLSVTGSGGTDTETKTDFITVSEPHVPEPGVIFDPEIYNPERLPVGMSITTLDGEKYLKVDLNGWDNFIDIDDYYISSEYSHFNALVKYDVVSSGFSLNQINTFLKLLSPDWSIEIAAEGNSNSSEFKEFLVPIIEYGTAGIFQVAGQETNEWNPTFGDVMWIGKVKLVDRSKPTRPDNLVADVDGSKVMLYWDPSSDNAGIAGYIISQNDTRLDSISVTNYEVNNVSNGTHTFSVIAVDLSGNLSYAKRINVTVGPNPIYESFAQQLKIYPNPANSQCIVDLSFWKSNNLEISIYNNQGHLLSNMQKATSKEDYHTLELDISHLPEGLYFISVTTDSFNSIRKLMIAR